MINKVTVSIVFPNGAHFNENIDRLVYRSFINFIKSISCVCMDTKCIDCKDKKICRYNIVTSDNFNNYPGVSMKIELFEKRNYERNEGKDFIFYLIGNHSIYSGYISVFFENLKQNLFHHFFYLKSIQSEELNANIIRCGLIKLKTPIEKESFSDVVNDMVNYFNNNYATDFLPLNVNTTNTNLKKVSFDECRFKTKSIKAKGYIGTYVSDQEIEIDSRLKEIGVGQYFYLGGGQFEIENNS